MSRKYKRRNASAEPEVIKKGGVVGKIVALLLGIIIGITAGLGGLAGAIYHVVVNVPVDDAVDTIEDITKTEIDISQVLTEEFSALTVWGIVGEIQAMSKEFAAGTGSFATLGRISPAVQKSVEQITETVAKFGLELNSEDLMTVPFKDLGGYLTDALNDLQVAVLLDKVNVSISGNPILMALCYGEQEVDYTFDKDGNVVMLGNAVPTTVGEFKKLDDLLNGLALQSLFNADNFDVTDPFMSALAFGSKTHYDVVTKNGKDIAVMKNITFTANDDYTIFTDVDGNEYTVTADGENYTATFVDGNDKTVYSVKKTNFYYAYDVDSGAFDKTLAYSFVGENKIADTTGKEYSVVAMENGVYKVPCFDDEGNLATFYVKETEDLCAYDKETGTLLRYQKVTVGDLLNNADPISLISPIELGALMNLDADANKALLTLAYGVEDEDYIINGAGEIEMLGNSKPRTVGDLLDSGELNELFNTLPISALLDVNVEDELMLTLAYGAKTHYTVDKTNNKVTMNPITFTQAGDKFIDVDGNEYTCTAGANNTYILNSETTTYTAKEINGVLCAINEETSEIRKYSPTTLSMLQKDPMAILDSLEIGAAMNLTPNANKILITLAYGIEGEDFVYEVDGEGNKVGFTMINGSKPMTIKDLKDENVMSDKIEELPLDALLEIDLEDQLILSLAYGKDTHYTIDETTKVVTMKPITFTKVGDKFIDVDNNEYTYDENSGMYTDGETSYTIEEREIDGVPTWCAIDNETDAILSYKKTTMKELQKDPAALLDNIALCDVMNMHAGSDPILLSLAYGNKGEDFYIQDNNGNGIDDKEDTIVMFPNHSPKTIKDLRTNGDLFTELRLATVLNVTVNSEPIMIELAYGVEGKDFNYIYATDSEGNPTSEKIGFNPINPPRTVADLQDEDASIIMSIQLATVLEISPLNVDADGNPTDNQIMLALAFGNKGQHYEIENGEIKWLENPNSTSEPKEKYGPRTIADLQGDGGAGEIVNDVPLYTVLNVSPLNVDADGKLTDNPIMVALAYGNNGEHYEIKNGEIEWKENPNSTTDPKEKYGPRTIGDLDDPAILDTLQLATILEVDPMDSSANKLMVALAFGNEGENYEYIYATDDEGNPTKIGYQMINDSKPRTIDDLISNPNLINDIRLATILDVTPEKDANGKLIDNALMVAIAYGNEGEHYTLSEDGKSFTWNEIPSSTSNPKDKYTYRTIDDLDDENILSGIQLGAALEITPDSDPILIALAYGNEGPNEQGGHYTYVYAKDEDGNLTNTKIGFKMNEGKKARTLKDLQDPNNTILKELRLATVLEVDLEKDANGNFVHDALMVAIAYGNEGQHYEIGADGYPIWKEDPNSTTDPKEKYTYRTIDDFTNNPDLFKSVYIATALNITHKSEPILIELAYGYEGDGYNFVRDNTGKVTDIEVLKTPRTLADLETKGNTIFEEIRLAAALDITPASDPIMIALAYGNEGTTEQGGNFSYIYAKDENGNDTNVKIGFKVNEDQSPRTLKDLRDPDNTIVKGLRLATVLEITPASNPILIAIAYGHEHENFEYTYTTDSEGNPVKSGFTMLNGSKPRTLNDLIDPDAKLILGIDLIAVMTEPDLNDALIMYVVYGGAEGARYEFLYEDTSNPEKKTGVRMLEQRIAILEVNGEKFAYDEYGDPVDTFTLTQRGENYIYTVTNDEEVSTTYLAKPTTKTMEVDYKNASNETVSATATVYWLYDENAEDTAGPLYFAPATIGDIQNGKNLSSIVHHLSIKQLVGESDSKLFQTIGDWRITDLQDQSKIMTLKIGEVIHIEEDSTGILKAMSDWSLNDLNSAEKINSLKIAEIMPITSDSPNVLRYMADPNDDGNPEDGWTLGDLNSDKFEEVELGHFLNIVDNDTFLSHLKHAKVKDLSSELNSLKISAVFQNKIFAKATASGVLYVDKDNNNIVADSEKIPTMSTVYKNYQENLYLVNDKGYLYVDVDGDGAYNANPANEVDQLVIGDHIWWYLLHNEEMCTHDDTNPAMDKQCYHEHTIQEFDLLIKNIKNNIEEATLNELYVDGLVTQLNEDSLAKPIKKSVTVQIAGQWVEYTFFPTDKTTLGELTVRELLDYVNLLIAYI